MPTDFLSAVSANHRTHRSTMEYFPQYNHPQAQAQGIYQHPAFAHSNLLQDFPPYADQHQRMYNVPRRSASLTNLNQLANMNQNGEKTDTKPRLSKQEVEILERQFQEMQKPTSITKRQLAERFNVDVARINVSITQHTDIQVALANILIELVPESQSQGQARKKARGVWPPPKPGPNVLGAILARTTCSGRLHVREPIPVSRQSCFRISHVEWFSSSCGGSMQRPI